MDVVFLLSVPGNPERKQKQWIRERNTKTRVKQVMGKHYFLTWAKCAILFESSSVVITVVGSTSPCQPN